MALITALGGLGLFLLAMVWLTAGLKELSGNSFRRFLLKFTRTPMTGVVTGAVSTAVLQSSSATTVMAIGFVGASLMSFPQALGIIFGANLGTTVTGWIVATLGFKLSLGTLVLPIFFISALMRLLGNRTLKSVGQVLAGFALLFLGIEFLKEGMAGLEGWVTPDTFPKDTIVGRLQLVGIGILVTLVTQSSSAGVAIAMAALAGDTITLSQAAAMIIGMDVGTTVTAALATVNGSTAARRTGWSHVIYNLCTGLLAFLLLDVLLSVTSLWIADPATALVAFHSGFNLLGVLLIIPFAQSFADLVIRLVPAQTTSITRALTESAAKDLKTARCALNQAVNSLADAQLGYLVSRLRYPRSSHADDRLLVEIASAIPDIRQFLDHTDSDASDEPSASAVSHVLHLTDHLGRLYLRLTEEERLACLHRDPALTQLSSDLRAVLEAWRGGDAKATSIGAQLNAVQEATVEYSAAYRDAVIMSAATGGLDDEEARLRLDAARWLVRVSDHLWRIHQHQTALLPEDAMNQESPGD